MKTIRPALASVLVILTLGPGLFKQPQQVLSSAKSRAQDPSQNLLTLPADITSYGGIFLQARINNSLPMWFVLDSGASSPFFIDTRRAKDLGLKLQGRVSRGGGAGPSTYYVAETSGLTISIAGLKYTGQSAAVIALDSIEAQVGRPLDGIVGVDLFTRYVVEIDYLDNKIRLCDPKNYTYSGAGESLPLALRDGHFFVPAMIEMPGRAPLEGQFLVDTGGVMVTAVLTTPFSQSNDLPASNQKRILDKSLSGLGGETRLLVSRATSFTLGHLSIRTPVVYVSQDTGGALASTDYEGLIGSEILRRFSVVFDYAHGRLILEPNAHYAEPVEYDMAATSQCDNFLIRPPASTASLHFQMPRTMNGSNSRTNRCSNCSTIKRLISSQEAVGVTTTLLFTSREWLWNASPNKNTANMYANKCSRHLE